MSRESMQSDLDKIIEGIWDLDINELERDKIFLEFLERGAQGLALYATSTKNRQLFDLAKPYADPLGILDIMYEH